MTLKNKDIIKLMEEKAPVKYALDYDNVGLMVGHEHEEVKGILFSLDVTMEAIDEAIEKKCNLIITHHPLLFIKPKTITSKNLQGKKILKLIENNIAVYSAHTNLDVVPGGINDIATELLGFKEYEVMEKVQCEFYPNCGVGRVITLKESIKLSDLCIKAKQAYETENLRVVGDLNKKIRKIALVNGSGEDYFDLSRSEKIDCIITGDTTYHMVSDLREDGIALIDAGHFPTEWPAMKAFSKRLMAEIEKDYPEVNMYISDCNKDTFTFV